MLNLDDIDHPGITVFETAQCKFRHSTLNWQFYKWWRWQRGDEMVRAFIYDLPNGHNLMKTVAESVKNEYS